MEAFLTGVGLIWLAAVAILPHSVDAIHANTMVVVITIIGTIVINLFLRAVWMVVTDDFPAIGRIEDWDI